VLNSINFLTQRTFRGHDVANQCWKSVKNQIKLRPPNDILCVGWDVKPYSLHCQGTI